MNDFFSASMFWMCAASVLIVACTIVNGQTMSSVTGDCDTLGKFRYKEFVYECRKQETVQ